MTWILFPFLFTSCTVITRIQAGNVGSKAEDACLHRPNPVLNQRWACEDPRLSFPTVACLIADIITCGKLKADKSCVFYGFGAKAFHAEDYGLEELGGAGIRFHDIRDGKYVDKVLPRFELNSPTRNSQNLNRANIHVRKLSQAFTSVCQGEAFLMVLHYQGDAGLHGIFQKPLVNAAAPPRDTQDNVWIFDEFPTLTQNPRIRKIWSVDVSNNNQKSLDWQKGGLKRLPRPADLIPIPPVGSVFDDPPPP